MQVAGVDGLQRVGGRGVRSVVRRRRCALQGGCGSDGAWMPCAAGVLGALGWRRLLRGRLNRRSLARAITLICRATAERSPLFS